MMSECSKRVLLVDDDEEILETVRLALGKRGYEVLVARDGAEGLCRAERDNPDLIVLDVIMPKRSGFTVLGRLRQSQARSPHIIMLTGNDKPQHRNFAESLGVDAFLSKPVDIEVLLAQVDTLLQPENPGVATPGL